MSLREVERILADVAYRDWRFRVEQSDSRYLQVTFSSDDTLQRGRKWLLSEHMTRSEIVQTAFKAVLTAEEHEVREHFSYKGAAIFGPHFDVEALVALARDGRPDVRLEKS